MSKERLDKRLVELGLAPTRQKAQQMIRAGEVKVNDRLMDKPGMEVKLDAPIVVKEKLQYVSRGGYKLAEALDQFGVEVGDRVCLDGGISTGGFTDCLLQRGAKLVYGVDVGYGQVAWEVRQNPRVRLKERSNFRHLTPEQLYPDQGERANLGVMDLSFISLTKLLIPLWNFLVGEKEVIALIKPQFEVGREQVGKKGVVRDTKAQAVAIRRVLDQAEALGWSIHGLTPSPIQGPAGNIEYLGWWKISPGAEPQGDKFSLPWITELTATTQQFFQAQQKKSPSMECGDRP